MAELAAQRVPEQVDKLSLACIDTEQLVQVEEVNAPITA